MDDDLLAKIHAAMSRIDWEHYRALVAMQRADSITPEALAELIHLTDQVEIANAERIMLLGELARSRQMTLIAVMKELGMQPPADD